MLLSSTSTLENKTIIKYHGLVNGESLIGSNIYKDLFSGVRDVVEGRTSTYAEDKLWKTKLRNLVPMES